MSSLLLPLALGLMKAGKEVVLVASENFREFVEGFGIAYRPIAGDSENLINSPAALKLLEGGNVFKFFYHLQKVSGESAVRSNHDMLDACRDADYLIANVLTLPVVFSIAERYNKKIAVVFLSLPPIPTREFPFQAVGVRGHRWINRLSYRLLGLSYAMIRKQVDTFRKSIGLPSANVLQACLRSNMLAIVAESGVLLRRPADWPPTAHVTGFLYLSPDQRAAQSVDTTPEGLGEWLTKGEKPVYIGFGSIPVPDRPRLIRALDGVLARYRVLLSAGWTRFGQLPVHPNMFVTKYSNHDWLLPRCCVAVIHGGIGTVGAVLRSGIPAVVVSVLADQPVNGKIIESKGLGMHIPFKKLTPERLVHAIGAVRTPATMERCRVAAERGKQRGRGRGGHRPAYGVDPQGGLQNRLYRKKAFPARFHDGDDLRLFLQRQTLPDPGRDQGCANQR
ncbi:nucleotide disphospho-sugar-binding domain-containing protein [Puia sp. P3]|uniref:nucleotide disphospho-sugar-binding domain-containing protein n=1 Tax=Puia sp. P3 TaxID=3423952 RepID=UPI003D669CC6